MCRVSGASLHASRGQRQALGEILLQPAPHESCTQSRTVTSPAGAAAASTARPASVQHSPRKRFWQRLQTDLLTSQPLQAIARSSRGSPLGTLPNSLSGLHPAILADRPTALLAQFPRELVRMHYPPQECRPPGSRGFDPAPSRPARLLRPAERSPVTTVLRCCGHRMHALDSCGLDLLPGFRGALTARTLLF